MSVKFVKFAVFFISQTRVLHRENDGNGKFGRTELNLWCVMMP